MDVVQRLYANYLLKPWLKQRLKKATNYSFRGIDLVIEPGVFHPRYFFSSEYLADFVSKLNLTGKAFAEPCTGSGLISLVARKAGAHVLCSDLDPAAVRNAAQNYERNRQKFPEHGSWQVLESDGFSAYPPIKFDVIALNPPYFFKAQETAAQLAWNCGRDGEFFQQFFSQLYQHIRTETQVYMVLAENCELERIQKIAGKYGTELRLVNTRKIRWEKNYIFQLHPYGKTHE